MIKKEVAQDARLNLVISSDLKQRIEAEAKKRELSTAAYVRMVLSDTVTKKRQ